MPLPPAPGGGAPVIYRVQTTDPVIFITIDDGTVASPEAMQFIKDMQMPVTMFLNEGPVRTHPDYFAELIALGNWAHSHTLNHKKLTSLDLAGQEREICGMVDVLEAEYGATGKVGDLVRAPYGASDATTGQAAASCGLQAVVSWTGTIDGGVVTLQNPALRPGDILLTHFKDDLYANLKQIRAMADAAGLRIARLEDYLA
jgi:peptidoglycan/xylan/chitin deacetylase (PgdA/CDA1 family)